MQMLTTRSIDSFLFTYQGHRMDAITKIKETYTVEEFQEIASHGWQSGVCHVHIYYGDTIKFYDTYEDEITEYIRDAYSTNFLVEMFSDSDATLSLYKNSVTWCFIEMIAFEVVNDDEFHGDINYGNRFAEDYSFV